MSTNVSFLKSPNIQDDVGKARTLINSNSCREALEFLLEIIKNSKGANDEQKENKIEPKLLPLYYLIGECYIKLNKI